MPNNLTPEELERNDKTVEAYILHCRGYSYEQIGGQLGCAKSTAWNWVQKAQQEKLKVQENDLNILRNTELDRLNDLITRCFEDLNQAHDVADDNGRLYRDGVKARSAIRLELLKYIQERSKLLGLYAPEKVEQFITQDSSTDPEDKIDYASLSTEDLQQLFADKMRDS